MSQIKRFIIKTNESTKRSSSLEKTNILSRSNYLVTPQEKDNSNLILIQSLDESTAIEKKAHMKKLSIGEKIIQNHLIKKVDRSMSIFNNKTFTSLNSDLRRPF